jgi:hypothetical protein
MRKLTWLSKRINIRDKNVLSLAYNLLDKAKLDGYVKDVQLNAIVHAFVSAAKLMGLHINPVEMKKITKVQIGLVGLELYIKTIAPLLAIQRSNFSLISYGKARMNKHMLREGAIEMFVDGLQSIEGELVKIVNNATMDRYLGCLLYVVTRTLNEPPSFATVCRLFHVSEVKMRYVMPKIKELLAKTKESETNE